MTKREPHDPVENLAREMERAVFTAARNWERRFTVHHADRDAIVEALRKGSACGEIGDKK